MTVALPFREPRLGQDYWIEDNILPNALEVAQRCIANSTWTLGSPWRPEPWPGMRAPNALLPEELRHIEECVTRRLGIPALQPQTDSDMGISGHNHIQLCGGAEGVARPHVDSAAICDYAAVLYLHPSPPTPHAGTSFYRLHVPGKNPGATSAHGNMKVCGTFPGCLKKWTLRSLRKFWRCLTCSIDYWPTNPT